MSEQLFNDIIIRDAVLSECEQYRYVLYRQWDKSLDTITYIGLNPSTADAHKDDQTIRKLIEFTKRNGYGGFAIVNLFAYRATKPRDLLVCQEPIVEENDK